MYHYLISSGSWEGPGVIDEHVTVLGTNANGRLYQLLIWSWTLQGPGRREGEREKKKIDSDITKLDRYTQ